MPTLPRDPSHAKPPNAENPDSSPEGSSTPRECYPLASHPDLIALGVQDTTKLKSASTAELLLNAMDTEGYAAPDPASAVLDHAAAWLRVLMLAIFEGL